MMSANAQQVTWPPLDSVDFAAMSIISSVEVAVAILVIHVVRHRSWLPYDAIIPQLVAWTGLAVRRSFGERDSVFQLTISRFVVRPFCSRTIKLSYYYRALLL